MNDDEFLNMEEPANDAQDNSKDGCSSALDGSNYNMPEHPQGQVIVRTFMQKLVFRIYPNGGICIDKAQCASWFTDQKEMFRKKEKKKIEKVAFNEEVGQEDVL